MRKVIYRIYILRKYSKSFIEYSYVESKYRKSFLSFTHSNNALILKHANEIYKIGLIINIDICIVIHEFTLFLVIYFTHVNLSLNQFSLFPYVAN